ncbi:MAG: hypothetical protein NC302_06115 [Bacteroidales bacterium]|nr:hypothetical protein [Bacteroidales bacterium]MCM1415891.1 hypothetical protein [bacterium]MCM1422679.1 hypothetical protein [bacterium]
MSQGSIQILVDSLTKKNSLLDDIILENDAQEDILKQEELDMDALDASMDRIGALTEALEKLDDGFEAVYDRVREDLIAHKETYRDEIGQMQKLIGEITDKVVRINAVRMRNKMRADQQFKKSRSQIGQSASKMKVSRNYYNSMNNLHYVSPQFYDSKQ